MRQLLEKYRLIYLIILLTSLLTLFLSLRAFFPLSLSQNPLFLSIFLSKPVFISGYIIFLSYFLNILLLTLISQKLFSGFLKFIPPLLYVSNFWAPLLTVTNSAYILLLTLFLCFFYSLILINKSTSKAAQILLIASAATIFYSSLLSQVTLASIIIFLFLINKSLIEKLKIPLIIILFLILPLLFLIIINPSSFKTSLKTEFSIYSDIGIINYINDLRGQPTQKPDTFINRLTENKYLYVGKYLTMKELNNLVPATFFTAQEKLFGFSFTPPIFTGFIIPFLAGFINFLKQKGKWRYLILASFLTLPALFSDKYSDLNRLILFYPALIYLTASGFGILINKKYQLILATSLILILLQFTLTVIDLETREVERSDILTTTSFNLGKQ